MKYLTILFLSSLFLISCGDRESPEIRFVTPTSANTSVDPGEQVSFQVEVTDNEALERITVGGDVSGLPAITEFDAVDKHNFLFNVTINEQTASGSEITVNVKATDLDENEGSEDLVLTIN